MNTISKIGVLAAIFTLAMWAATCTTGSLWPIVVWLGGLMIMGAIVNAFGSIGR